MVRAVVLVAVVSVAALLVGGACARSLQAVPGASANDVDVPVDCAPRGADAVLCRVRVAAGPEAGREAREGRRLLGRIGFLAGLHLGGAISHSGSLSASHSLNVFGKTMNTALSVSYGPNGYYQGPGGFGGGRPPLNPIAPGFGLADDPAAASSPSSSTSTSSPNKGGEASAVLAGSISRDATRQGPGLTEAKDPGELGPAAPPQNRLPVAEDIGGATPSGPPPHRVKVVVEAPASAVTIDAADGDTTRDVEPAPVAEEVDEDVSGVVGEEPEPPPPRAPPAGVQLSTERRAQLEAVAVVRAPTGAPTGAPVAAIDEQRRLFLQHHNKHVATFNAHHAKYNGDVSRVALFSRS